MSHIRAFFRHCPGCGRRFEIRLESKTIIREDRATSTIPEVEGLAAPGVGRVVSGPLLLSEGRPITVATDEFQYVYRCAHCGHEWTEKHDVEHLER